MSRLQGMTVNAAERLGWTFDDLNGAAVDLWGVSFDLLPIQALFRLLKNMCELVKFREWKEKKTDGCPLR